MEKYIYRGETERNFYLAFTKAVGLENITEDEVHEPLGVIIVAKDYEGDWIAQEEYYLGWKIEVAPVAVGFLKGFADPHWSVIKDSVDTDDYSSKYIIYKNPEGKIVAETMCSDLVIAESLDDYYKMSEEEIEALCYNSEMNEAR